MASGRMLREVLALLLGATVVLGFIVPAAADDALPKLAVPLGLKIISLQKRFGSKPEGITVYVLSDAGVAKAFQSEVDRTVGTMKLSKVLSGDTLPEEKPDVLFVGDRSRIDEVLRYTRNNKVLSMARNEKFAAQGVTLAVFQDAYGKLAVTMNMSGAALEGIEVNPATLKVAMGLK